MASIRNYPVLQFKPTQSLPFFEDCFFDKSEIKFKIILRNDSIIEEEKQKIQNKTNQIIQGYGLLVHELTLFHGNLKQRIESKFIEIKERCKKAYQISNSLGIPLRSNAENQLKVNPVIRKKIELEEPKPEKNFQLEPCISETIYKNILETIHDACRNLERMPSLFKGKEENDFRDFILFVLDPNFRLGSATGETFNKQGKTDILLRYSSSNVFVAECKIWSGIKNYFSAIDQLLSYLTWRDSKSSLIIFVNQKNVIKVCDTVMKNTENHQFYVSSEISETNGILRYKFNLPSDSQKEIDITVMIYHIYWENNGNQQVL